MSKTPVFPARTNPSLCRAWLQHMDHSQEVKLLWRALVSFHHPAQSLLLPWQTHKPFLSTAQNSSCLFVATVSITGEKKCFLILCIYLAALFTGPNPVLNWPGRPFDPKDLWEHPGQQVWQGAQWCCCSAPIAPTAQRCNWRNKMALELKLLQLVIPMAFLSSRANLLEILWIPNEGASHVHMLFLNLDLPISPISNESTQEQAAILLFLV